jgi:hypothetical protein
MAKKHTAASPGTILERAAEKETIEIERGPLRGKRIRKGTGRLRCHQGVEGPVYRLVAWIEGEGLADVASAGSPWELDQALERLNDGTDDRRRISSDGAGAAGVLGESRIVGGDDDE